MIRQDLGDPILASRLASLPPDGLLRFTLLGGTIRGALVSGTTMVAALRANHGLGILETLALGQAYLTAALASVTLKDGGKLVSAGGLHRRAQGLLGRSCLGRPGARFLFNDSIVLDRPLDSFDLAPFIGKGTLSAPILPDGEPFTGHIELVHAASPRTSPSISSAPNRQDRLFRGNTLRPQGQVAEPAASSCRPCPELLSRT
jgi:molecular chaperone Hsp33